MKIENEPWRFKWGVSIRQSNEMIAAVLSFSYSSSS